MKVIMLAASDGARLGQSVVESVPKIMLNFNGKSLLERHIEIFRSQGISELVLGVGFQHVNIHREIEALGAQNFVRTVLNTDFELDTLSTYCPKTKRYNHQIKMIRPKSTGDVLAWLDNWKI